MVGRLLKTFHNMGYCFCHDIDLLVVVHNDQEPTDEEWDENFLPDALTQAQLGMGARCLICTGGGRPSSKQRKETKQWNDALQAKGRTLQFAIVTDMPALIRVAIMAMNVFVTVNRTKVFESFDAAYQWLDISSSERVIAAKIVDDLRRTIQSVPAV